MNFFMGNNMKTIPYWRSLPPYPLPLTPYERSALKELSELTKSHRIVIMLSDKGGSIVILNSDHYRSMVQAVFNDPDYFEPCDGNQSKEIFGKIDWWISASNSRMCDGQSQKSSHSSISVGYLEEMLYDMRQNSQGEEQSIYLRKMLRIFSG